MRGLTMRRPRWRCANWLVASVAVVACSLGAAVAWCQSPPPKVQAFLEAGEFGPALQAARQIEDVAARDQALGAVAVAQAHGGAQLGSLATAYDIRSDLARQAALERMGTASGGGSGRGSGLGGGVMADFDSLIELITTTIAPQSWDEVGGPGSVDSFEGGVRVDAAGLLQRLPAVDDSSLSELRKSAAVIRASRNPHHKSALRMISLPRLERAVQLLHAAGKPPTEAMQALAGLSRVKYVFVYPETGDLVLAGPAGDWQTDAEGRFVTTDTGSPIVTLDDLVVTLRNAFGDEGKFGCSINPRQANLAAAQAVNDEWSRQPLKPSQRARWLEEFRSAVGKQDIVVYGIDPRTRAARVLVEADYRMKLVGMGLEPGTLGVTSYLQSIEIAPGQAPPPMNVLRWWFTLNYSALKATAGHDAFALAGQGAKVLGENERLTERGERVHTGTVKDLNRQFADSFTKQFEVLAAKYPVYADLRNIFDLALVTALMKSQSLPDQVDWHMTHFGGQGPYSVALGTAPTEVDSIVNHRLIGGKTIVAGVSGGVTVDARQLVAPTSIQTDDYGLLNVEHRGSAPKALPRGAWWWD